jgi:hypothetical protein
MIIKTREKKIKAYNIDEIFEVFITPFYSNVIPLLPFFKAIFKLMIYLHCWPIKW